MSNMLLVNNLHLLWLDLWLNIFIHLFIIVCSTAAGSSRKLHGPLDSGTSCSFSSHMSHLSDHPVPNAADQLAVFPIGNQVKVIGELDGAGQLLQDVYAEALTAQLCVGL